jgi:hypothetical protein
VIVRSVYWRSASWKTGFDMEQDHWGSLHHHTQRNSGFHWPLIQGWSFVGITWGTDTIYLFGGLLDCCALQSFGSTQTVRRNMLPPSSAAKILNLLHVFFFTPNSPPSVMYRLHFAWRRSDTFLRNVGNHPQDHMTSQPRSQSTRSHHLRLL